MRHRIVAEPLPDGVLKEWHMVRGAEEQTMCGRELVEGAQEQSEDAWGTDRAHPFCHTCGALYLRETP
ncbi:hypothetical protein [Streptomyces sp. NBC_00083]|uniref:hypothetical protein n=1 Tax=Streptomyces sp. NBC_00083 TaxID=2975647 RepID=UPI00225A5D3D|nr:hypothetical protein [Streptomyces sp. NBC_00083]MCX5384057.1 hypothetical protein [Streptomyces sp. NBC_00083]